MNQSKIFCINLFLSCSITTSTHFPLLHWLKVHTYIQLKKRKWHSNVQLILFTILLKGFRQTWVKKRSSSFQIPITFLLGTWWSKNNLVDKNRRDILSSYRIVTLKTWSMFTVQATMPVVFHLLWMYISGDNDDSYMCFWRKKWHEPVVKCWSTSIPCQNSTVSRIVRSVDRRLD